jgi:hypothetical protein
MAVRVAAQQPAQRQRADPQRSATPWPWRIPQSTASPIHRLQRAVGNRATSRFLHSSIIQPKLTISEPGDAYEREADRVADQVMRMSYSGLSIQRSAHQISRQCQACEKEQDVDAVNRMLQRIASHSTRQPDAAPDSVDQAVGSPGTPLEPTLREEMEQRFGYSFSGVRVHTGTVAQQSARDVGAHAYTVGHNVVFAGGQYAPGTHEGRRLISHELTHVVQQSGPEAIRRKSVSYGPSLSPSMIQDRRRASSSIGQSISRAPDRLVQRDEEGKETKKGVKQTAEKKALEEERKTVLAELGEIETNWKEVRNSATGFSELADWLGKGDTVIGLLRTHTELALEAKDKGDTGLASFMTGIVESDVVMYRFITWHTAVLANLLTVEPQVNDIAASFAADDREFTGRDTAEESVKLLQELAVLYRKAAPKQLELAKFVPATVSGTSGRKITLTVSITAHHDKSVIELFRKETEKFIQDQAAIEVLVGTTNQFLEGAFAEGLLQAAEAIVEYYSVRGSRRGGPKTQKTAKPRKTKGKGNQKQKKTKKQKCSQAVITALNVAMHALCDKPRSCSNQLDTCATATAKVATGQACVRARTELQQKCFSPGDPGYETHMQAIAEANAALRNCVAVMAAKCK